MIEITLSSVFTVAETCIMLQQRPIQYGNLENLCDRWLTKEMVNIIARNLKIIFRSAHLIVLFMSASSSSSASLGSLLLLLFVLLVSLPFLLPRLLLYLIRLLVNRYPCHRLDNLLILFLILPSTPASASSSFPSSLYLLNLLLLTVLELRKLVVGGLVWSRVGETGSLGESTLAGNRDASSMRLRPADGATTTLDSCLFGP